MQILWKEIWKRPHYTKSFDVERYLKHCIVQHSLNRKWNSAKCRFLYKVNSGTNMKQFKLCWKIFERVHARSQVANYCIRAPFSSPEVCLEVLVEEVLHSDHVMKINYIHRNHIMLIIITMPWSLPYSMINIDNMKRALTIGWWQQTAWQKASHVRQQLDNYIHRNHIMLIIIAMPRLLPYSRMNTQKWDHNVPSWEEMITFYNCWTRDWWKTPAHAQTGLFFLEQLFP